MKKVRWNFKKLTMIAVLTTTSIYAIAQDGNSGINEANSKVRSYFDSGTNLM